MRERKEGRDLEKGSQWRSDPSIKVNKHSRFRPLKRGFLTQKTKFRFYRQHCIKVYLSYPLLQGPKGPRSQGSKGPQRGHAGTPSSGRCFWPLESAESENKKILNKVKHQHLKGEYPQHAAIALLCAAALMRRSAEHTDTPTNPHMCRGLSPIHRRYTDYYITHSRAVSLCV